MSGGWRRLTGAVAVTVLVVLPGCGGSTATAPAPTTTAPATTAATTTASGPTTTAPTTTVASASSRAGASSAATTPSLSPASCSTTVVAAGDIVNDTTVADRTGRLAAAQRPAAVLVLGDNQYPDGSLGDYRAEYDRTAWGRLKPRTHPVPGNHEYRTPGAAGYFAYFDHPDPYYAYDAGCGWRGYALDSETDLGPQATWLARDLAAHPSAPVLLSWHRPRWSSGTEHGSDPAMQPLWTALAGRTGVVLNGHEHDYERFAPVGHVREFVVGTGGTSTYDFGRPVAGSQARIAHTPGVLRLTLEPHGAYRWAFLDTAGSALDAGTSSASSR